ncbi:MAG: PilZ domain-containing protein [Thiobacillaceae bacterium]|jgi:hypothetical protein|nr:PilZ domain-containing protein [Thiobacillaceae bacterium]
MTDAGLRVTLDLPCALERLDDSGARLDAVLRQSLLVLRVVNQAEGHPGREGEAESQLDRLEAKLDLALHLLARSQGGERAAPMRTITLHAGGFDLADDQGHQAGDRLLLHIHLCAALPLPLRMPAWVVQCGAGLLRAEWIDLPAMLSETWAQWLFRRHRRQIHEQREGRVPGRVE